MPFSSSPLYLQSSSPPVVLEKRKRNYLDESPVQSKRRLTELSATHIAQNAGCSIFEDSLANAIVRPTIYNLVESKRAGPFFEDENDTADDSNILAIPENNPQNQMAAPAPAPDLLLSRESQPDPPKLRGNGSVHAQTAAGKYFSLRRKSSQTTMPEELIPSRSKKILENPNNGIYGIDINNLIESAVCKSAPGRIPTRIAADDIPRPSVETPNSNRKDKIVRTMMWTEKYRAKKFTDLVGDERTHRQVLRWLKGWDPIVFPASQKFKSKSKSKAEVEGDPVHRKILLLTGPPGLGKTTLAHVCARQAGYEVVEINASDERNRDVVKGKIRDCVATENVKGISMKDSAGIVRKAGRPICVILDEVDGVVSGSSNSGEGGFIKALIDLVALDRKNSDASGRSTRNINHPKRGKKGERFRFLRPLILICNDVYHPALRPLRSSSIAEIIHIRRPPLDKVVARLKAIYEKEGVFCDDDGVRRLCEAAWGISDKRETRLDSINTGEGDIRGVLVVGEWAASQMRASTASCSLNIGRITKRWVEQHLLQGLSYGGASARGLSRGGIKEVLGRVFIEGAGFSKSTAAKPSKEFSKFLEGQSLGVSELGKRSALFRLREMVETCGEYDRIVADCFAAYPSQLVQDDVILSKPDAAYDWLQFHDSLSSKVYSGQEWELSPYLSQTILSFHYIFASPPKHLRASAQKGWDDDNEEESVPFSGLRADYEASEAQKANRAVLLALQSSLSILLLRSFRSVQDISVELLPYLARMLAPDIKPMIMGGSGEQTGIANVRYEYEREMLKRAAGVMNAVGVSFEHMGIEDRQGHGNNFVYRMEP